MMVAHILDGPIIIAHHPGNKENLDYFIYYTLKEIQPARYQCYVFAIITRENLNYLNPPVLYLLC